MFVKSGMKSNCITDDIILICKAHLKEDDNGVAQENKTTCSEGGCTGRAVAFDFIKSGIIDKINTLLVNEMETSREDKKRVLELYEKFKALRHYRSEIDKNKRNRNLPTLIQTFYDQDVIPLLCKVTFYFDENIEKSVDRYKHVIDGYKEEAADFGSRIEACQGKEPPEIKSIKADLNRLNGYIQQGSETYKYLLQQLVCIKAYIYHGNNPINQKRPTMSHTANLLRNFSSGELFFIAKEIILPTIGIIARDAGHTKCSAVSIHKLTALIQQYVDKGMFAAAYMNSSEGEDFFELFMDAMGFISDSVNKTKNGKAAYAAVHLAEDLLNQWMTGGESSADFQQSSQKMEQFDNMTKQMVCELYHGDLKTFRADEICQNPEVKIERPNYYNSEKQDKLRYGVQFSTPPTLLDSKTFKAYYGIKDSKQLKHFLESGGDRNPDFSIVSGSHLDDCTIKITLGDIDEIIDKPLDAIVSCNPENFEDIQLNQELLDLVLLPENSGKHNKILLREYRRRYEKPLEINPKHLKKGYIIGDMVSRPFYDVLPEVEQLIARNMLRVLSKINLKTTLYEAGGVEIPKCTIFIVGNDNLTAQAIEQDANSPLLLPTNIVVLEQGDNTALFAFDPSILHGIKDLAISKSILDELKERIHNIVQLKHGVYDDTPIDIEAPSRNLIHHARNRSYAMTKTYSGAAIDKVLDKVLFVSKISKFEKEFTQLGLINLKDEQKKTNGKQAGREIFVPLIGKLETVATDVANDPSVLAMWPYRLSVENCADGENVIVSAIKPSAMIETTGDSDFKSFGVDMSKRLSSTFDDVQSELTLVSLSEVSEIQ